VSVVAVALPCVDEGRAPVEETGVGVVEESREETAKSEWNWAPNGAELTAKEKKRR
jgi:hypothetical protein